MDDDELDLRTRQLFEAFEDDVDEAVEAPAPAAIRRRGQQRRQRRHAAMAVSGLAALALAAGGSWLAIRPDGPVNPQVASAPSSSPTPTTSPSIPTATVPSTSESPTSSSASTAPSDSATSTPSTSSTPTPGTTSGTVSSPSPSTAETVGPAAGGPAITYDDLASADELVRNQTSLTLTGRREETSTRGSKVSPCEQDRTALGQTTLLRAEYTAKSMNALVLGYEFPSVEAATSARSTIRSWYANCASVMQAGGYTDVTVGSPVTLETGSNAKRFPPTQATFRRITSSYPGPNHYAEEASLYQVGNRLEWIVFNISLPSSGADALDTAPGGSAGAVYPGIEYSAVITNRLAPGN